MDWVSWTPNGVGCPVCLAVCGIQTVVRQTQFWHSHSVRSNLELTLAFLKPHQPSHRDTTWSSTLRDPFKLKVEYVTFWRAAHGSLNSASWDWGRGAGWFVVVTWGTGEEKAAVCISRMWNQGLVEQFFRSFSPEVNRLKWAVKRLKMSLPLLEEDS